MIIKVRKSQLFTTDPAIRFANEYDVPEDLFRELWKRYNILEYTISDLCEVRVWLMRQIVQGKPNKVSYFAHPQAQIVDTDTSFQWVMAGAKIGTTTGTTTGTTPVVEMRLPKSETSDVAGDIDYPEEKIRPEDIPF